MTKRRTFIILLAALATPLGNARGAALDDSLKFHSVSEFFDYLKSDASVSVHPEFRTAVGFVLQYSDDCGDPKSKDARLLAYVNGETPRRLMLWGLRLRVEALRRAVVAEQLLIAKHERVFPEESVEQSEKLYRHRMAEAQGWQSFCERLIDELTKPNQTPEPTAMLVTPRAGARVAPSTAVAHL